MSAAHRVSIRIDLVDGYPEHTWECELCRGYVPSEECSDCKGAGEYRLDWCPCAECERLAAKQQNLEDERALCEWNDAQWEEHDRLAHERDHGPRYSDK